MKTLYKNARIASILIITSSLALLTGCASTSPGKLSTQSGRPEITIPNSNIQTVMDGIAAWLAAQGKPIVETGVYTISASITKPDSFMGISYKSSATATYTIVQNGANVELYEEESGHGGDFTEQSDYEEMQKDLTQIAEFLRGR
jgi:hypothetical protein